MRSITTKIILISTVLSLSLLSVISSTILLNQKDKSDAYVVNIAGKQRMLTQKIAKEVFFLYTDRSSDFSDLDSDIKEFSKNLKNLLEGNPKLDIYPPPDSKIKDALLKVEDEWREYAASATRLKDEIQKQRAKDSKDEEIEQKIKDELDYIAKNNKDILNLQDSVVSLYTAYSESRRQMLESFQYISGVVVIFLLIYAFSVIRGIQKQFDNFIKKSQELASARLDDKANLRPMEIDGDDELADASRSINSFIKKVDTLLDHSSRAQNISEQIADEVSAIADEVLDRVKQSKLEEDEKKSLIKEINKIEDMAIESSDGLMNAVKLLKRMSRNVKKLGIDEIDDIG